MSKPGTDQPSGKDKDKDKDGEQASPIADDWDVDFGANSFGELTTEKRIMLAIVIFIKLCLVVGALYFFICALSFMATGFRLVSCSSSSVAWVGVVPAAVVVPCPHPTSLPPPPQAYPHPTPPRWRAGRRARSSRTPRSSTTPWRASSSASNPKPCPPTLASPSPVAQAPFSNPNSNPDPRQACSWACS